MDPFTDRQNIHYTIIILFIHIAYFLIKRDYYHYMTKRVSSILFCANVILKHYKINKYQEIFPDFSLFLNVSPIIEYVYFYDLCSAF